MLPRVTGLIGVAAFGRTVCVLSALLGNQPVLRAQGSAPQLEEIYIARSVRESRTPPSEFCAPSRTGFADTTIEGRYAFRSTATRSSDGRMVDRNVSTIGSIHGCFGRTSAPFKMLPGFIWSSGSTASTLSNCWGVETDPPGYTQSSIATIRLWKRR